MTPFVGYAIDILGMKTLFCKYFNKFIFSNYRLWTISFWAFVFGITSSSGYTIYAFVPFYFCFCDLWGCLQCLYKLFMALRAVLITNKVNFVDMSWKEGILEAHMEL